MEESSKCFNSRSSFIGFSVQQITMPADSGQRSAVWASPLSVSILIADTDGDGTPDSSDNCSETHNPGQQDTNGDGYGNACDTDLDNDGFVGPNDYILFGECWYGSSGSPSWTGNCETADFDSNGFVRPNDYTILGGRWHKVHPGINVLKFK